MDDRGIAQIKIFKGSNDSKDFMNNMNNIFHIDSKDDLNAFHYFQNFLKHSGLLQRHFKASSLIALEVKKLKRKKLYVSATLF